MKQYLINLNNPATFFYENRRRVGEGGEVNIGRLDLTSIERIALDDSGNKRAYETGRKIIIADKELVKNVSYVGDRDYFVAGLVKKVTSEERIFKVEFSPEDIALILIRGPKGNLEMMTQQLIERYLLG
ncbi:MAG: hypothetical protein ABIJ08_02110 [Nanoarchaeota archaeon]